MQLRAEGGRGVREDREKEYVRLLHVRVCTGVSTRIRARARSEEDSRRIRKKRARSPEKKKVPRVCVHACGACVT